MNVDEDRYGPIFEATEGADLLGRIWEEAYGDQYPAEIEPFGFLRRDDLLRLAEELSIEPGESLVDLGCGAGGPGLWIAARVGARLTGIDILPAAVARARSQAAKMGMGDDARFEVASMANTGQQTGGHDAALAIDSFWMTHDKHGAATEVARILGRGGGFGLTTWQPSYFSYAELLGAAGFEVKAEWEPEGWLAAQQAVYRGILREAPSLRDRLGEAATAVLVEEARDTPATLSAVRRVCIVAERI